MGNQHGHVDGSKKDLKGTIPPMQLCKGWTVQGRSNWQLRAGP